MLKLGELNKLEVLRSTSVGMYLGAEDTEDVLLPLKYIPDSLKVGDEIEVFIYRDSEGRIIATTLRPKILLHSFACLEVVAADPVGVFFDMGLEKDLFVPDKEQNVKVSVGDWRIVYMLLDTRTQRLIGSMKWKEFCFESEPNFTVNQKVNVMIGEQTNLGRNVLIENAFYGLIYFNEIFEELKIGDVRDAYIKAIREDGDIDVSLQQLGYGHIISSADKILELLNANHGVLGIGDKSSPDKITSITGMSKKTFKKGIGTLYKARKIEIKNDGIHSL